MSSNERLIEVTKVIAATPQAIFDVLANPAMHPVIDGSGAVVAPRSNPDRLFLGATFTMDMSMKASYRTTNVVSSFEENRTIAWHHKAGFIWRYDLEPVEGGTKVTESFDYRSWLGIALSLTKLPEQNRVAMTRTLDNLARHLEANDR